VFFRGRHDTAIEILALRQQLAVLKRKPAVAALEFVRSDVLDDAMPRLAAVGRGPGRGETRNGTRLAPRGISFVLEEWNRGTVGGSCRRELLDHVTPLNEDHLRRLVRDCLSYFHEDRIHDNLDKDTPNRRRSKRGPVQKRQSFQAHAWVVFIIATAGARPRRPSPQAISTCALSSPAFGPMRNGHRPDNSRLATTAARSKFLSRRFAVALTNMRLGNRTD